MQTHKRFRTVSVVAAFCAAGAVAALPASAAVAHSTMTVTKSGKVAKLDSKTSFSITSGTKTYVATTNDMTHVTIDGKASKVASVKKGVTVTVKGNLEMDTITAATVTEGM